MCMKCRQEEQLFFYSSLLYDDHEAFVLTLSLLLNEALLWIENIRD
jgi:hypothetical protein